MPDNYSADTAVAVLQAGGNAVDAAIAAAFVLAVTYPEAGNIGGGGFMLLQINEESHFLDYRETAPRAARREMYLDDNGNVIKNASIIGVRAAGVPGTVAGLWEAHQRFGSKTWASLVRPAIQLARQGFKVHPQLATLSENYREWFAQTNFEQYFGKLSKGEKFRQPELADSLQRIADQGATDFYNGVTAELLAAHMRANGGLITRRDLADYRAVWRQPVEGTWRGYRVVSSPPPSSGGIAVIQLLGMKEDLEKHFEGLSHNSAQYVHLVAEMSKRVFADRAEYLGDPDFTDVPVDTLLSPDYIRSRAREVRSSAISTSGEVKPGIAEGSTTISSSPFTTHFSIVDAQGNAVSNTYTLNWDFGSGSVVTGAGFLLNNEMDDFSVKPGVPNLYGVVGGKANEIQPGKRMLSSMAPTLLLKGNDVQTVIGTPGGSTIITSVFQGLVNLVDFNMSPDHAAAASRFHHQLLPVNLITYSPGFPLEQEVIEDLTARGYEVSPHDWEFGNLQIIQAQASGYAAGTDPRGRGVARVFSVESR